MKLNILGKFGTYPPVGGGLSSYLVRGGNANILLDFGSGAISRVQSYIPLNKIDAIVLSHLHNDHISDLLPFSYFIQKTNEPLDLYLPFCDCPQFDFISSLEAFNILDINSIQSVMIKDLELTFSPMTHSIASYAVRVRENEKSLVYSGDTTFNQNLVAFCEKSDLLVLDCGKNGEHSPHMSIQEVELIAKTLNIRTIASHLNPEGVHENITYAEFAQEMETYII